RRLLRDARAHLRAARIRCLRGGSARHARECRLCGAGPGLPAAGRPAPSAPAAPAPEQGGSPMNPAIPARLIQIWGGGTEPPALAKASAATVRMLNPGFE